MHKQYVTICEDILLLECELQMKVTNVWNKNPMNSLLEASKVVYVAENPSLEPL
jgi:hypothetical protein